MNVCGISPAMGQESRIFKCGRCSASYGWFSRIIAWIPLYPNLGVVAAGGGGEFQTNGVEDFTAISFYLGKQRLDLLAYLGHVSATSAPL